MRCNRVLLACMFSVSAGYGFQSSNFIRREKCFNVQSRIKHEPRKRMAMTARDKSDGSQIQCNSPSRRNAMSNILSGVAAFTVGTFASSSTMQSASAFEIPKISNRGKAGGLALKIRGIGNTMDQLQRDLMQERWDLVEKYPPQLRSLVPLFTTYTDSAFPSEKPSDYGLRVALRYEVGRFFASLERLKLATSRRALNEAYVAYSDMSLHYDRYLHVGGLYTYYDATISNEIYFKDTPKSSLVYADPVKDPPEVRDLVVLVNGPDIGKTGILIGIYDDESGNCVVKLDKYKGMREILLVNKRWVAKRLGEQDPDDVFLIPRK